MGNLRKALLIVSFGIVIGVAAPVLLLLWLVWQQTLKAEETRLADLSQELAAQTEYAITDARNLLEELGNRSFDPCSRAHLLELQNQALSRPHIRAIGYWQAADRLCGVGLIQAQALMPPNASRIYDSGVIAWWPSESTTVGDVALFLMRFGNHDVAIDPGLLITPGRRDEKSVALWVEGMEMARFPKDASLPLPGEVPEGLSVDQSGERIISRASLGSLFPIDIVAVQSFQAFWNRYQPLIIGFGSAGLAFMLLWLALVWRFLSRQFSLESALRSAIDEKDIDAVYQPIIDLSSGRCVGAEVLGRWTENSGTQISPDVFVPLAEKCGMGTDLTLAVLEALGKQLLPREDELQGLVYHLNLTEQDLTDSRFSQRLQRMLDHAGIGPERIALEITERALLDADLVRERVAELRDRGHLIAIDDFGTAYSSLSYLETFDLDTLKIDKTFVDTLDTQAVTSSVIVSIIDLAKSLSLEVVAEGIESQHQIEWLVARGVKLGQGYWYSPPLSADEFESWCLQRNNPKQ